MASFYRIDSESSRLPSMLSALEEQNFLFQLQLQDKAEEDSSEVRRHDDGCVVFLLLFSQSFSLRSAPRSDGKENPSTLLLIQMRTNTVTEHSEF